MAEGPQTIWQKIDHSTIPAVNLEVREVREILWEKIKEPRSQRKIILVIVCIALLLDNMLYMVIVPIIPDYLRYIGAWGEDAYDHVVTLAPYKEGNKTITPTKIIPGSHEGQDSATGVLFASKAIVQLMINPFSGALIDRIGYDIPMMIGLIIMFLSTSIFACGRSYGMLFFARSLQGVGSAFADTSGLAMIADRFTEENERSKALGIALAFISFGCLVAPPFGGSLYQFAGKEVPFLILALISLIDGFMLLLVMKPLKTQMKEANEPKVAGTPIWKLLMDPYIAVCAGALMMSNVALAFLEPTISTWMEDNLTKDNWKIGMIWLPAFFPHVLGVVITVNAAKKYPQQQWLMAAGGLALEGLCCFIIPFASSYKMLMIPICGICFGIALIDTALLPTLGFLVDVRYVSVYGSIYAIADISYSFAYAVGPIIAGEVVEAIGFTALNLLIAFSNLLYAPVLMYLRHIYDFKPFENEANILMSDPPEKEYQTYTLQDQRPVDGEYKNHLEYSTVSGKDAPGVQESNIDADRPYQSGYQNYGQGFEQKQEYQQQEYSQPRQLPAQPQGASNPFRSGVISAPPSVPSAPAKNPFRQAWGESLLSLPKRWLSQAYSEEEDFQNVQLPKLPVPDLDATLDSYLDFATVIVNQQQLEHTRSLVKNFASDLGPNLQTVLLKRQKEMENWVTEWWLDDMYLKVRLPLPINSNPGMIFPRRRFAKMEEVADLGALFVDDLLDYKEMLDRGELPIERATSREKGQPLCMQQFYRLLGVCRIPQVGKDRLEFPTFNSGSAESEELIIVACRNYFYPIPVKATDRGRLTPGEIQAQLLHVMVEASGAPPAPRVGLLTAMNRDQWAVAREQLAKDETNRTNLELISRSLCLLCLDESGGDRADMDADTNAMLRAMHGGGTRYHSANRWFDKTVQLTISSDGTVGMCYEHSAAEGVAVIRLAERALARAEVADRPAPPPVLLPAPQAMKWNLTPDMTKTIETAARDFDRQIADLDFRVYTYRGYGREFIKSCRTSPDAYIQLALQYAHYKMYGYLVSTYESASLRRFRDGRVDNIRSAHSAARAWAAAMCTAETSPLNDITDDGQKKVSFNLYGERKKLELFEEAARKQTAIMEANILGKGIDNHLLGLREAAREALGELPPVFKDDTYKLMTEFKLSTSQVATTIDGTCMGYGAVLPDGYGCAYNPKKDSIIFCISSFHSSSVTNTEAFKQSLEEALDSMKLMFQNKILQHEDKQLN